VSWDLEQKWIAEFHGSYNLHHSLHKNGKSTYPNASYICNLPIAVDGLYLDQCARGLSILGIPFFYCCSQELMLGKDLCNKSLNLAVVKGEMFNNMKSTKLRGSKDYLTESLIQFVINWIFQDAHSPLTQQFHVVPMVVASVVTQ
jgi:hypothetical protein